jgi:hypothetical protein
MTDRKMRQRKQQLFNSHMGVGGIAQLELNTAGATQNWFPEVLCVF